MSPDTVTALIIQYKYWMLILLAFIEGPVVAFTAGLLSSLGYFNPWVVLAIMIGKDMAVDGVCYAVGYWGNETRLIHRYSSKIGVREEHWKAVEGLWEKSPWRTMFISKLSYGLSLPFLISAGLTRISYKRYWLYAAEIALLQYGVLMALGYFFGNSVSFVKDAVNLLQIGIAAVALFVVAYYLFSSYMRRRTMKNNEGL